MKKIAVWMLFLAIVLAGCTESEDEGGIDLSSPFIGGTIGINTYFLEGMPPPLVQDNGQAPFSVAIVWENQGESDLGPSTPNPFAQIHLEGINPVQWGLGDITMTQPLTNALRGARRNFDGTVLPGEITIVSFEGLNYMPNIRGNTEFIIRADLCYDYETISTTKICLKDDVLENIQDQSICSLTGEKYPQNSGAPLQVTSVIQNPLAENKIQVNFIVEHVGIGEFYGRTVPGGGQELCRESVSNFNKHNVEVIVEPLSDPSMTIECPRFTTSGNSGTVKLFQGAPQIISCIVERTSQSRGRIFQDILTIRLRYRYGQFIETPIIVQDVTNEPGAPIN